MIQLHMIIQNHLFIQLSTNKYGLYLINLYAQ